MGADKIPRSEEGRHVGWRLSRVMGIGMFLGLLMAAGSTCLGWLPPVVPRPTVEAKTPSPTRRPEGSKPATPPPAPELSASLGGVRYSANALARLDVLAGRLHWQPWIPRREGGSQTFSEAYVTGRVLCLIVGRYLAEESRAAIPARIGPSAAGSLTLANGQPARWWWVPGEAGGYYRLNFREGALNIRLAGANSLAQLKTEASGFSPLAALQPNRRPAAVGTRPGHEPS